MSHANKTRLDRGPRAESGDETSNAPPGEAQTLAVPRTHGPI